MRHMSGGHNTDGEGVAEAYARLAKRPEKRKILMVLSDGQPAADGCSSLQQQHLRNTIGRIESEGCDVIGVGIESSAVKRYYPKWVVCNSLQELPKATMDMVSKALMGNRFVVDNSELIKLDKKFK